MMTTPRHDHPMKRAIVVGGVASFVHETAAKKLARWGFVIERHVEMGKHRKAAIPSGRVDAVIIFSDMMPSRDDVRLWREEAEQIARLPCVVLPRKESHWPEAMRRSGFEPINPVTASAVAITEEDEEMAGADQKHPGGGGKVVQIAPSGSAAFMSRKEQLKKLLKEMAEQDGVREVIFSPESGLSLKRVAVETFEEEV